MSFSPHTPGKCQEKRDDGDTRGLIKSIHGGGGKGTAHLTHPDDEAEAEVLIDIRRRIVVLG